jgi:hypothetical protein
VKIEVRCGVARIAVEPLCNVVKDCNVQPDAAGTEWKHAHKKIRLASQIGLIITVKMHFRASLHVDCFTSVSLRHKHQQPASITASLM